MAKAVTDATFKNLVVDANRPVLVDFWAEWCGPCRQIAPIIDELATEYEGRADIYKMDIDNNRSIPASLGIMSIPTLMIFSGGEMVKVFTGATAKAKLKKALDTFL